MSQRKLLHELLREDQEPFVLKNYVADRRRLLKKPSSSNTQVQKSDTSTWLRNNFCGTAFRFVLQDNQSSACRTPEFSSPATSPSRQKERDNISYDVESLNNLQVEEEDKEQCSPVSILDPPFEDDDGEDDGDDLDCSSATVEREKPHLPSKLSRFEKLVELDPVVDLEEEEDGDDDDDDAFEEEKSTADKFNTGKFSRDVKRLIADIIAGEERYNYIDMMVEGDLKMENAKKINEEEIRETAVDVELAILAFLVEELAIELDC